MTAIRFLCCLLVLFFATAACSDNEDPKSNGGKPGGDSGGKPGGAPSGAVSLPDDFPKDVPMPDFLTVKSVLSQGEGTMVQLTSRKSAEEIKSFYQQELKQQGWTEKQTAAGGGGIFLGFTKELRECTVSISQGETTQVMLTVKESSE